MSKGSDVLERSVIHAGKVFIKAGEESIRAYVIQAGQARSFTMEGDNKIEIARYGPGTIIGETCLVIETPMDMSFEAVTDTTVVTITRQDFEKKLAKTDGTVKTILNHMVHKLQEQDGEAMDKARRNAQIDDDAFKLVHGFTAGLPPDRKHVYEKALLPDLNKLIKTIKALKKKGEGESNDGASPEEEALEEKVAQTLEAAGAAE